MSPQSAELAAIAEPDAVPSEETGTSRVRLFPRNYEKFCLLIPCGFAALIAVDFLFVKLLSGGATEIQINRFITSLFFLNSIHVYFTFVCLFRVPECRDWVVATTNGRPWRFWLDVGAITLVAGILTAVVYFSFPITAATLPLIGVLFVLVIPYHHQIMQIFGLSMLYNAETNKRFELSKAEKQRARDCARRERWGFNVFMVSFFTALVVAAYRYAFEARALFPEQIERSLFAVSILSIVFILGNCLLYPRVLKSNKPLFLSRMLFYPLLPVTLFADPALRACHGTEYLCVTNSIAKNSSMTKVARTQFVWLLGLISLIGAVMLICRANDGLISFLFEGGYSEVPVPIKVLAFVSIVLTYTHIYVDRRLFRFRHASNREHILPLLQSR